MDSEKRKELYIKAREHFGVDAQLMKTMEELSELITVLAKDANNLLISKQPLVDEMVDACIMLEQLNLMMDTEMQIMYEERMEYKLNRLEEIINKEQELASVIMTSKRTPIKNGETNEVK